MAVLSVTAKKLKSKQKKGSTSGEGEEKPKEKEDKEVENMEVVSWFMLGNKLYFKGPH